MITGQYVFYENGKEILRSPNVITKFGKRFFTNLLAGNINNISKDIAIGIDQSDAEFLRKLKPRTYIRKAPYELPEDLENSPLKKYPDGDRRNVGFIAQEVRDLLIEMNIPIEDFAGFDGSDPTHLSLIYAEFVPVIVKSLQEKRALIKRLRQRIESLEERT